MRRTANLEALLIVSVAAVSVTFLAAPNEVWAQTELVFPHLQTRVGANVHFVGATTRRSLQVDAVAGLGFGRELLGDVNLMVVPEAGYAYGRRSGGEGNGLTSHHGIIGLAVGDQLGDYLGFLGLGGVFFADLLLGSLDGGGRQHFSVGTRAGIRFVTYNVVGVEVGHQWTRSAGADDHALRVVGIVDLRNVAQLF